MPDLELVKQQLGRRGQSIYQFDFCRTGTAADVSLTRFATTHERS